MKTTATLLFAIAFSHTLFANFTINNSDTVIRGIICPANVLANTDPGICIASGINLGTPAPVGNFIIETITNDAPSVFPKGETIVIWTATDASGITSTCTQIVVVKDNEIPSVVCPGDRQKGTDYSSCDYTAAGNEFDPVLFNDNCPGATIINDYNALNTLDGAQFPQGVTDVMWIVTDMNYNTITCLVNIIVNDNIEPVIICRPDQVKVVDQGEPYYTVKNEEFDPLYSDNCAISSVINSRNASYTLAGATFPIGSSMVSWIVTDADNNTAICSFDVIVKDTIAPLINCVVDQLRSTDQSVCDYTTIGTEFDPVAYSDNIPGAVINNNYSGSTSLAGAVFAKGTTVVTWTITDIGYNTTTCIFNIVVKDNEVPTFSCAGNQTREINAVTSSYMVIGNEFDPVFTDNCPGVIAINDYNSNSTLSGESFPLGSTTITWYFIDEDNNSSDCSCVLTINRTKSGSGFDGFTKHNIINKPLASESSETIVNGELNFKIESYPNPFSENTTISFMPDEENNITLNVYDLSGSLIATLYQGAVNKDQEYHVKFDGSKLSKGIYLFKLSSGDHSYTGRMILAKE